MSQHRKTFLPKALTSTAPRILAGAAMATGVFAIGLQVVPAHAKPLAAEFAHVEDEGIRFNGFEQIKINKTLSRERIVTKQRADRAKRTQLEAARPKWMRPVYSAISSPFGYRWGSLHPGVDFAASVGTPVRAAGDGVVTATHDAAGYGILLNVAHPDGATTWYCHLSSTRVNPGQRVKAGDIIGYSGMTGYVTGPHLHFEVRFANTPVDPVTWLRNHGVAI